MSIDDDGWELSNVGWWDTSKHDVKYECIGGIDKVWLRPRKPVVETVTLYWGPFDCSARITRESIDTHTITLTKINGVWQRDAVLEEIK